MVQVTAELTGGLQVTLSNGRHTWRADEPVTAGGTDTGPNPYDLLTSALAACTVITLTMYCRHKQIPLTSISARCVYQKVNAQDRPDLGDHEGMIDLINTNVRMAGTFDDAQRKRLTQIVARCPVHRTFEGGVTVVDEVEFTE